MRGFGLVGFALLVLAGCGVEDAPTKSRGGGNPLTGELDIPMGTVSDTPLPAYRTASERSAQGKADALVVQGSFSTLASVTPAPVAGIRAIAEWEHVDSVVIHWDEALDSFFDEMVNAVHRTSNVHLITADVAESEKLKKRLGTEGLNLSNIKFFEYANNSIWSRDFGPITVEMPDGAPAFVDLRYFPNRTRDDLVPTLLSNYYAVDVYRPDVQAEGGNFMSNGNGICGISDVIPQRNGQTHEQTTNIYKQYMGCKTVIIGEHLIGEGTGHIDMWAKFTREDVVLVGSYAVTDNAENAARLDRNAAKFAAITFPDGHKMKVIRIPMPASRGQVFESFTNSLVINNTVIIPRYDDAKSKEAAAFAAYKEAFPEGYSFKWVDSTDVIEWGGAVHCTTMGYAVGPIVPNAAFATPVKDKSFFQANPVVPIADVGETDSTISVPTTVTDMTGDVSIDMSIEHTFTGDLLVTLEHAGKSVVVFDGKGPGQNVRTSISTSAFAGLPKAGEWKLVVNDTATGDVGTLWGWRLGFDQ